MDLDDTLQGSTISGDYARKSISGPNLSQIQQLLIAHFGQGHLEQYIREYIAINGQKTVANAIGRSVSRVSEIQSGTTGISLKTMEALLAAVGLKCVPIDSEVVSKDFLKRAELTEYLLADYLREKVTRQ